MRRACDQRPCENGELAGVGSPERRSSRRDDRGSRVASHARGSDRSVLCSHDGFAARVAVGRETSIVAAVWFRRQTVLADKDRREQVVTALNPACMWGRENFFSPLHRGIIAE